MSVITMRISEKSLHDLESHAQLIHVPRAEYIRMAIEHMNQEVSKRFRTEKLKKASLKVRKESMRVNKEFSKIEHDPKN